MDEFIKADLRDRAECRRVVKGIDDVYQLAADMGGAGYVFTGRTMRELCTARR
jgi:GDP-D-mannose 3', 5'-epimerase